MDMKEISDLAISYLQLEDEDCICLHGKIDKDGRIDLSEESKDLLKSLKKEPAISEKNKKQNEDSITLYSIEELFEQGYVINRKGKIYLPEREDIYVRPEHFHFLGKTMTKEEFESIGELSPSLIKGNYKYIDKTIQKVNVPVEIELNADDTKIFMLTQKNRIDFTEDDLKFVREYTRNFKNTAQNKTKEINDVKEKIEMNSDLEDITKGYNNVVSSLVKIKEIITALNIIHNKIMQIGEASCGKE